MRMSNGSRRLSDAISISSLRDILILNIANLGENPAGIDTALQHVENNPKEPWFYLFERRKSVLFGYGEAGTLCYGLKSNQTKKPKRRIFSPQFVKIYFLLDKQGSW